jgi:hypothetical protein
LDGGLSALGGADWYIGGLSTPAKRILFSAISPAPAWDLLRRNMIGADHIAPKLDLPLEQSIRRFGRFLVLRV